MSTETVVQQQTRLLLAQHGAQIWRNNSGAFQDETGRWIRYGLANDSKKLNSKIKSSDLIGGIPVVIQPHHVGKTVAVLSAFEVKPSDWVMRPSDERACAQAAFHDIVRGIGGFAGFVTNPNDIYRIVVL